MTTRAAYAPGRHTLPIAIAVVVLCAVIVHLGVLGHGFTLDDEGIVQRNPLVHAWSGLWRAFVSPWWPAGGGQYRPLVLASFTAEWWLGGGSPAVFHAVNLAWHALVVALVMLLVREVGSVGGSVVAGLLFAVHPVHVEAVAGIVGRAELMAAAGLLAALLLHRRGSAWATLAFAVALASKEHAVVFPVLALLLDRLTPPPTPSPREPASPARPWRRYLPYLGVLIVWAGAVAWVFRASPPAPPHPLWLAVDAPARWLTMLGLVPTWLRLFVAPFDLSVDYAPAVVSPWPAGWPMSVLGAGLLVAALLTVGRAWRSARPVAVGLLWIGVTLLPVANLLLPTGIVTAERVLYLPSVGAVLLIVLGIERVAQRRTALALALAGLLTITWTARTVTRIPVWASNKTVLLTTLADHPESSLAHALLGRVYAANHAHDLALQEFVTAAELFPMAAAPWIDGAQVAVAAGRPALADSLLVAGLARGADPYPLWMARGQLARQRHDAGLLLEAGRRAARLRPLLDEPGLLELRGWLLLGERDSARATARRLHDGNTRARAAELIRAVFGSD